jgi:L-threonylcarbamoyladenylate synthase
VTVSVTDAARLEECLYGDGVAVIPTDTVYGLACNPASEAAVRRIYELKRRPPLKPSAVMFFALESALEALSDGLGSRTRAALSALLPGPLTLLLPDPARRYPLALGPTDGDDPSLLGLRVPVLTGPLAALAAVSAPALQSSANFSGEPDPRRLADVPAGLRAGADLVLDGGDLPGTASTVLDMGEYERTGEWHIVRAGPIGEEEIERLLG